MDASNNLLMKQFNYRELVRKDFLFFMLLFLTLTFSTQQHNIILDTNDFLMVYVATSFHKEYSNLLFLNNRFINSDLEHPLCPRKISFGINILNASSMSCILNKTYGSSLKNIKAICSPFSLPFDLALVAQYATLLGLPIQRISNPYVLKDFRNSTHLAYLDSIDIQERSNQSTIPPLFAQASLSLCSTAVKQGLFAFAKAKNKVL